MVSSTNNVEHIHIAKIHNNEGGDVRWAGDRWHLSLHGPQWKCDHRWGQLWTSGWQIVFSPDSKSWSAFRVLQRIYIGPWPGIIVLWSKVNIKLQDGAEEEGRILGLAMVPGHHVTRSAWEKLWFVTLLDPVYGIAPMDYTRKVTVECWSVMCRMWVDQDSPGTAQRSSSPAESNTSNTSNTD